MTETVKIPPRRAFVQPEAGDSWEALAHRLFPETPAKKAVEDLQSWNLFLMFRPGGAMTPSDIVFTEPPRPSAEAHQG